MKQPERDELLIRIDERTQQTAKDVKDMHMTLHGNGNPEKGMVKRFDRVEHNQEVCQQSRQQRKMDLKWIAIAILALFEAYAKFVACIVLVALLSGCATEIYFERDKETKEIVKYYKRDGFIRWSAGEGKMMPFSEINLMKAGK